MPAPPDTAELSPEPVVSPSLAPDPPEAAIPSSANAAAEQQLWQDVERVLEKTGTNTPPLESESEVIDRSIESSEVAMTPVEPTASEAEFTEPIPWGLPANAVSMTESTADETEEMPDMIIDTLIINEGDNDTFQKLLNLPMFKTKQDL